MSETGKQPQPAPPGRQMVIDVVPLDPARPVDSPPAEKFRWEFGYVKGRARAWWLQAGKEQRVSGCVIGGILFFAACWMVMPRSYIEAIPLSPPPSDSEEETAPPPATVGALQIVTSPAELAVYVDGVLRGSTPLDGRQPFRSAALVINSLAPGPHQVRVIRQEVEPVTRDIEIQAGKTVDLQFIVWRSDTVISLTDGRTLTGMIVVRTTSYTDLATQPASVVRLLNSEIADVQRTIAPVMLNRPDMAPKKDPKTGTPEYIFDPFPSTPAGKE